MGVKAGSVKGQQQPWGIHYETHTVSEEVNQSVSE